MMSVMTKITGHRRTPAVRSKLRSAPRSWSLSCGSPSVPSKENILTPINSAIRALATKKPAKMMKSRCSLANSGDEWSFFISAQVKYPTFYGQFGVGKDGPSLVEESVELAVAGTEMADDELPCIGLGCCIG